MKKRVLTGDRPTGKLHLGHYAGSLQNRLKVQATCEQFIMIADLQALTDHFEQPALVRDSVLEVAKDYIAIGLESTVFLQSQIPALSELTMFYMNLVTMGRLERNPTVKAELKQKAFGDSVPAGFFCYPVSQAADITAFQAELVPVGEDQLPMIEQTNEIVRKFQRLYGVGALKECSAMLSETGRLVGIDGKAKASKSLGNAIFLADSAKEIKQKVQRMYTDPGHVHVEDPGCVEGNVVFAYLDVFFADKVELASMKERYRRGGFSDGVLKALLTETLQHFLGPIREKRESLVDRDVLERVLTGSTVARKVADATLLAVKEAMCLNYGSSV